MRNKYAHGITETTHMKLLIVESPSKAKTIEKYLEGAYTVRASVGHVRDLPTSNKKAIDIAGGFIPHYEISKGKEKVVHELQALAKKAEEVLLATDPDREGEAISWHIESLLKSDKKITAPFHRITFNEITKEAVHRALLHPRAIDTNLRKAQEARRVLDRLVGYDLSGVIWKKVRYGLSAGRVQSPALRIIVEREREIKAFIPEAYWTIQATVQTPEGVDCTVHCVEEPRDKAIVDSIITHATTTPWYVAEIKVSEQKRSPRAPFTTSTLQQTASSRLGFSPSRTMMIAQKLYEAGHITYMRTDSTTLSGQAIQAIAACIEKLHGSRFLTVRTYKTKAKNAQEAHEAIRPTHPEKRSAGTTEEQKRLYALIWERTLSSQMSDALIQKTKVTARTIDDAIPDFTTTGSTILFPGWLAVDTAATGEDVILPSLQEGSPLTLLSITDTAKHTEPPHRYSEAGLVKELESRGIGRPSTYASIISTLEQRGYVEKIQRALHPTPTGEVVSTFLEQHFMKYISDTFTAEMENELDEIASGERDYTQTLSTFYEPFKKEVAEKETLDKATTLERADEKYRCPLCGESMFVKLSRAGTFLSCQRYPECTGALTIDGVEITPDTPIGIDPTTGLPIYVLYGRFGPYVQLGEKPQKGAKKKRGEKIEKPKMASIPKTVDPSTVTVAMALTYLSLPRTLGEHPDTKQPIIATAGRFGPYVAHEGNYRSIKAPLDVYTISLSDALTLLAQEKKPRGFKRATTRKK